MQVRNNDELTPVQLHAYVNRNEKISYECPIDGKTKQKLAKPRLELIHIPALATVEIDDELWNAATVGTTTRKVFEETWEDFPDIDLGKNAPKKRVLVDTGKREKVNMVQEMIKAGRITIVEHPKLTISLEDMQKALKEAGVPTSKDADELTIRGLYDKVCR